MPTEPYLEAAYAEVTPTADNVTPALAFSLQQCLDSSDPARCYDPQLIRCAAAAAPHEQEAAILKLKAKYGTEFNKTQWRKLLNHAQTDLQRQPRDAGAPWEATLLTTDKGKPLAAVENALIAFRSAKEWRGVLNFDLSSMNIVVKCPPPWKEKRTPPFNWTDQDDTRATAWLERKGIMLKANTVAQAVQTVAQDFSFHPILDYLDGLTWDGVERIDYWVETYLGVRPPESADVGEAASLLGYIRAVSAKFLIGAVARVIEPGCKLDTCLILEGPQGARKSTALRTLFHPWFTDDMADINTKDASMQTRGVWLIEFGELDTLGKAEASRIKAFTSRAVDRFRPPYGRRVIEAPRESIFAGTVNQQVYLKDETGGRRFWPVFCGDIDIPRLTADKDQLWAEALTRYNAPGATWWLEGDEVLRESVRQQESRYEQDPWQDLISPWLDRPTQRILGQEGVEPFTSDRESTTILDVLLHAIGKRSSEITQTDRNRVSQSLRSLKWSRRRLGPRGDQAWRYVRPI